MNMTIDELERTVINSPDSVPDWESYSGEERRRVTKIIVGRLPSESDSKAITMPGLPDNFAANFSSLTHLYLWNISALQELPALPPSLKWLDVRGCAELRIVSCLPPELVTLDLGNCKSIENVISDAPPKLQHLFIGGCNNWERLELGVFLKRLRDMEYGQLVELDATGCDQIDSTKYFPRSLQRLVLKDCHNLESLQEIGEFSELRHLNLGNCKKLESLPDIPPEIQYLELVGCDSLNSFMSQDVAKVHRDIETNAAQSFHSRKKFGEKLACSANAKLLFLGDGRVGKSTLAKRLQWNELSQEQREDPSFQRLKPVSNEDPTHKIRFWKWNTKISVSNNTANNINVRAEAAGLVKPFDDRNQTMGSIRLWDFGGQEIYHQTHRLFASTGSVFLVLWRAGELDENELYAGMPDTCTKEEWRIWNRRRSLDYWLEYIESIRPSARIALVCTCCPKDSPQTPWATRAIRWTERALRNEVAQIPCFYIESLDDDDWCSNPEFANLVTWIRENCGTEAANNAILQPEFFSQVAKQVDDLLVENDQLREKHERPVYLLESWENWTQRLTENHRSAGNSELGLETDDISTITTYLHGAGQIFFLSRSSIRAVLIDQEWATSLIYSMFSPANDLCKRIKEGDGIFAGEWFSNDLHWSQLQSEFEREQILAFMQDCGIIVRLASREQSRTGRETFLATEKWLLPTFDKLENKLQAVIEVAKQRGHQHDAFTFENKTISEFDFRALMVRAGKILGFDGTWFRDGLQATDDQLSPEWCFRVSWIPNEKDSFFGTVDAVLVAPPARLHELKKLVEDIFAEEPGDRNRKDDGRLKRRDVSDLDLTALYFRSDKDTDYHIAVSSRGKDAELVGKIVANLIASGLKTKWYRQLECRSGEYKEVLYFMESFTDHIVFCFVYQTVFWKTTLKTIGIAHGSLPMR